jgi:hypothetical protein
MFWMNPSTRQLRRKLLSSRIFTLLPHFSCGQSGLLRIQKMLRMMKLLRRFFVLLSEANDKLYVAEIECHDDHNETPAPRGRPANSFAGADC